MTNSKESLQAWLKQNNIEAFWVTKPENVLWLTGFSGSFGAVLVPAQGTPTLITDSRYQEVAEDLCAEQKINFCLFNEHFKISKKNIAGESSLKISELAFWRKKLKAKIKPQKNILEQLRRVKTEEEIKIIKSAQAYVDQTLPDFVQKVLKENITEAEAAFKLEVALRNNGRYGLSFDPILAFGKNSSLPHHHPGQTKLNPNTNILIDCGIKSEGYCTDMTRNFAFGQLSSEYINKYDLLLKAQEATLKQVKADISPKKLDTFCRKQLGDQAEFFTHSLGHGVGLEIHEMPGLSSKYKAQRNFPAKLQTNEIITIEPGLYYPGKFGIRIEDLVVVKDEGCEVLSKASKLKLD